MSPVFIVPSSLLVFLADPRDVIISGSRHGSHRSSKFPVHARKSGTRSSEFSTRLRLVFLSPFSLIRPIEFPDPDAPSLRFDQGYSTENLTATQLTMLEDLNETGFIYRRTVRLPSLPPSFLSFTHFLFPPLSCLNISQKTSKRFYPTRLATTLSSQSSSSGDPATDQLQLQFQQQQQGPPPTNISTVPSETGFIVIETNFRVYAYTGELAK